MIYTLGHKANYDEVLRTEEVVLKTGKHDGFPGGSVWETFGDAEAYRQSKGLSDFAVYGVFADWNTDTSPNAGGNWHDLLVDARIVAL